MVPVFHKIMHSDTTLLRCCQAAMGGIIDDEPRKNLDAADIRDP
jgi:hypothetical protein